MAGLRKMYYSMVYVKQEQGSVILWQKELVLDIDCIDKKLSVNYVMKNISERLSIMFQSAMRYILSEEDGK